MPDSSGPPTPRRVPPSGRRIRGVVLAFALLELAYFLPMVWGWYPVQVHLFSPKFTGVSYQRNLPPWLNRLQSYDPTGVMMDFPNEAYTFGRLRHGELPWWNPDTGCGRPWIGNAQVHPFSPLLLPLLAGISGWLFSLQFVLGSMACLWGGYWFFRLVGCDRTLAVLGSALWTWNPFTTICLQMSSVWAYWWMPWAFCGLVLALRHGLFRGWAVSACAFALMALCGQPETAFWMAYLSLFLFAALWLAGRPHGIRSAWVLGGGLSMALLALALSAAQWGPIWEVLSDASWYKSKGLPPGYETASLLNFLGSSNSVFLLPVLCGLAVLAFRPNRLLACGFAIMLLFCLCLSVPPLFESLPFRLLRGNGMIPAFHGAELACVPLTALAILGLAALRSKGTPRPGPRLRACALALVATLTAFAIWPLAPFDNGRWLSATWLLMDLGAFALLTHRADGARRPGFIIALAFATVAYPLALTHFQYPDFGGSPLPAWQAFLKQAPPAPGSPPARFWAQSSPRNQAPFLLPNLNLLCETADVRGSTVLNPPGTAAFSAQWSPPGHFFDLCHSLGLAPPALLRFLGADRAVVESRSAQSLFEVVPLEPGPRAFLVGEVEWQDTEQACVDRFKAFLSEGALRRRAVLLGTRPKTEQQVAAVTSPVGGSVLWQEYRPERQQLRVECIAPCLLLVTDTANRFWKASVDGRSAPILRADVMFRGVWLEPGRHEVAMWFDGGAMWPYLITSLVAWLALAAVLSGWSVRRFRVFARRSPPPT